MATSGATSSLRPASRAPWGGIANWNADPLTGRSSGFGDGHGALATWAAAQTRDILFVANGELDMTDITSGVPASLSAHAPDRADAPSSHLRPDRQENRRRRSEAFGDAARPPLRGHAGERLGSSDHKANTTSDRGSWRPPTRK